MDKKKNKIEEICNGQDKSRYRCNNKREKGDGDGVGEG